MPQIVALGELLIDLTQTGSSPDGFPAFTAFPGGAPANVAVAAARLGTDAAFIGKTGSDSFGRQLRQTLADNKVDVSGLYETPDAPTTLAVVSVDEKGERSFSFYRSPGADTLLTAEEAVKALVSFEDAPVFFHVGSLSLTSEPSREATFEAVRYAKTAGSLISYDPNYRASLWSSEKEAKERMRSLLPYVDIIKLSEEELPLLTDTSDPRSGSIILSRQGISLVLITLGENGAFYRCSDETGLVPGRRVDVADTNGAGDTFLGALLTRLLSENEKKPVIGPAEKIKDCVAFANNAAALTCMKSGAIPAMPDKETLENYLKTSVV